MPKFSSNEWICHNFISGFSGAWHLCTNCERHNSQRWTAQPSRNEDGWQSRWPLPRRSIGLHTRKFNWVQVSWVNTKNLTFLNVTRLHCDPVVNLLNHRCCTMFSSCLWTLNCKPVDSEIIPSSSASFHNTSLEAIVFYIFHPKKDRIVDKGRSISSVDWGKYAHMCSSDETVFKCLMPANVVIIYLAEANVSILRLNTLEEIYIVTWVKLEQQNVIK